MIAKFLTISLVTSCAAFACASDTQGPALADSIAQCAPGAKLGDCQSALKKNNVNLDADGAVSLVGGAFDSLRIEGTGSDADAKVAMVAFHLNLPPGKGRREIVTWLKQHLPSTADVDQADGNIGCGADSGGPAWTSVKNAEPEVQFAVQRFPTLKSTSRANMEELVAKTKTTELSLCFRMPRKNNSYVQPIYALIMPEFLKSAFFSKVRLH